MANYIIQNDVWKCVADYRLPESLGFGLVPAPVMYSATFDKGRWNQGEMVPYGLIEIVQGASAVFFADVVVFGL